MNALLTLLIDIMRLRAAPQDIPFSRFLMLLSIGTYLLMGLVISLLDQDAGLALLSAGIDTVMLIGLAYLALKKPISRELKITFWASVIFGGLTLVFRNETFILWKHGSHMLNYDTSRGGIRSVFAFPVKCIH